MAHHASRLVAAVAGTAVAVLISSAAASAENYVGFTSPSGNIGCMMSESSVRCDIAERDWSPPPAPADCPGEFGQGVTLGVGNPARFVCAGDTALNGGAPLSYGDKITRGSLQCDSSPAGITCWDFQYGGEFSISREAYHLA